MTPAAPARIHLLPARDAPCVIVVRRKPSSCFHIVRWNTRTDQLEHGSWFKGKLYAKRCDVSFDGRWMVYLAMGASGETWNGICHPPFLRTVAEGENMGSWFGGGFWRDRKTLVLNQWQPEKGSVPFRFETLKAEFGGEDLSVLYSKWQRDGWQRRGDDYGTERNIADASSYQLECNGDDGWQNRPTNKHPALIVRYAGYLTHGYTFHFELEGYPDLLDTRVDSACWDSLGCLLYSRQGILYRYSLKDLELGQAGAVHDLESLVQPDD